MWRDPYGIWRVETRSTWVRLIRSPNPYTSLEEIDASFVAVVDHVDPLADGRSGMLVDFRHGAPARNDKAFERRVAPWRPRLFLNYPNAAVLIRTAAGRMQLTRTSRVDGQAYAVFDDEAAALAFVRRPAGR